MSEHMPKVEVKPDRFFSESYVGAHDEGIHIESEANSRVDSPATEIKL